MNSFVVIGICAQCGMIQVMAPTNGMPLTTIMQRDLWCPFCYTGRLHHKEIISKREIESSWNHLLIERKLGYNTNDFSNSGVVNNETTGQTKQTKKDRRETPAKKEGESNA